jgi:hypothetical protein
MSFKYIFFIIFILFLIKFLKNFSFRELFDIKPIKSVIVPFNETWSDIHSGQCTFPNNNFFNLTSPNKSSKLAFLFMISDNIDWINLWNKFFNNININHYEVIIHRSNPDNQFINLSFPYKIINTVNSSWCNLVNVKKALIYEALLDNNIYGCVFISNHCVPIKNFHYIRNLYLSQNNSILRFSNPNFTKASLWCYLNRKFMNAYINSNTNNLPDGGCQEEMFLGKVIRNFHLNVIHGIVTFDCWNKSYLQFVNNDDLTKLTPLQFKKLNIKLLNILNKSQICFLRKVDFNNHNFNLVYNNIFSNYS